MGVFSYRIVLHTLWFISFTALGQDLHLEDFTMNSPELSAEKRIWVLLPDQYGNDQKRFPVIYMHDAQNLFDKEKSYAGEWEVDETMAKMHLNFIVIGIEHGEEKRIEELTPYPNAKYGGGKGEKYASFIVDRLKPRIDSIYRTLPGRSDTFVAGSSLGGLISHYLLFEKADSFTAGIIFSPSYWYSEKIFDLTTSKELKVKPGIYMATGEQEPQSAVEDHQRMIRLLKDKGYTETQLHSVIRKDAGHNELFWREEFPRAMTWIQDFYKNNQDQD